MCPLAIAGAAEHTEPQTLPADRQHTPWWLHFHLWGFDAPLAALAWALVYVRQLDILSTPGEPIFLLCVAVWAFNILGRLIALIVYREHPARCWKPDFYRAHLVPLVLLLLSALLSALWLAFYQVGVYYLSFAAFPAAFWLLAVSLPVMWRESAVQALLLAWTFALSCSAPAWFYSIAASPRDMLFFAPTLAFTVFIFLFNLERKCWLNQREGERLQILLPVGLFLLLIFCIISAPFREPAERSFYYATAMGAALLQVMDRLSPFLSRDVRMASGWLLIALPGFFAYFLL